MIDKSKRYRVYNYNPMTIVAKGISQEYIWENCNDINSPTIQTMRFEDIEEIFSKGKSIQAGYLTFSEDEEKDIYKELGFDKKILKNSDIDKMILEVNSDLLQEILAITDMYYFDRIRMCLVGLKNAKSNDENIYDVSMRFIDIINKRYEELLQGKLDSQFATKKVNNVEVENPVIEDLKKQIEDLKKIIVEKSTNTKDSEVKEETEKTTKSKKTLTKKDTKK